MNVYILQMLYYDRINVSEGIDVNKISASRMWCLLLLVFFKS